MPEEHLQAGEPWYPDEQSGDGWDNADWIKLTPDTMEDLGVEIDEDGDLIEAETGDGISVVEPRERGEPAGADTER